MISSGPQGIVQHINGMERLWSLEEIFGAAEAFAGEIPEERVRMILSVVDGEDVELASLSEAARMGYTFWKMIRPGRILELAFSYAVRISASYDWQVDLRPDGIWYTDLSGLYGAPGDIRFQLLSDFWFYGPSAPLPGPEIKKNLIAAIRSAFTQVGGPAYDRSFELFEYPDPNTPNMPYWSTGDPLDGTYVIVRNFGVEYGRQNFRDGLVWRDFHSFEHIMSRPDLEGSILTAGILEQLRSFIRMFSNGGRSLIRKAAPATHPVLGRHERSRQLFMENMGMVHQIYRDGMGDEYQATAAQEEEWRMELVDKYLDRIGKEDHPTVLRSLVDRLVEWQVSDLESRLIDASLAADARQRQAIAGVLWDVFRSDHAFDILLGLRDEEPSSYWKHYVTSSFGRMFDCPKLRKWVLSGLHSGSEDSFTYAADILRLWVLRSENGPVSIEHLLHLTWLEKQAGHSETLQVLRELDSILR